MNCPFSTDSDGNCGQINCPFCFIIGTLLGCSWGRTLMAPDDLKTCPNQAVQILVLHNDDSEVEVKLCAKHRDRILADTTPHGEA